NARPSVTVNTPLFVTTGLIIANVEPGPLSVTFAAPIVVKLAPVITSVPGSTTVHVPPVNVDPAACVTGPDNVSVPPLAVTDPGLLNVIAAPTVVEPAPVFANVPTLTNVLPAGTKSNARPFASMSDPLLVVSPDSCVHTAPAPSSRIVAALVATA